MGGTYGKNPLLPEVERLERQVIQLRAKLTEAEATVKILRGMVNQANEIIASLKPILESLATQENK